MAAEIVKRIYGTVRVRNNQQVIRAHLLKHEPRLLERSLATHADPKFGEDSRRLKFK